jgi:hypothetical protein
MTMLAESLDRAPTTENAEQVRLARLLLNDFRRRRAWRLGIDFFSADGSLLETATGVTRLSTGMDGQLVEDRFIKPAAGREYRCHIVYAIDQHGPVMTSRIGAGPAIRLRGNVQGSGLTFEGWMATPSGSVYTKVVLMRGRRRTFRCIAYTGPNPEQLRASSETVCSKIERR